MTVVRVGDLMVSDESGFACGKSKLVDHGLPHLRPFNITDDGRLELGQVYQVPVTEAPKSKKELLPGDVLFNNTNSAELVGKTAIIREPMAAGFSNHLTRIRVDAKRVEPAYFAQWLRRLRTTGFFTAQATQWVSQAAFRTSELRALEIDLPSMGEQRRVVDLLARAEGIVCLRREAKQKAAELIPAIFIDMFGDPATNPKGWPVAKLGELLSSIDSGHSPKCSDGHRRADEWGVLRLGAVSRCEYDETEHKTLPRDIAPDRSIEVKSGDLLLSRKNTPGLVGASAYVWTTGGRVLLPDLIFRLQLMESAPVSAIYLWKLLTTDAKRSALTRLATGSAGSMPNISKERLRTLPVEVPTAELQLRFANLVKDVRSICQQQQAAIEKAEAAFASLLADAFSGM